MANYIKPNTRKNGSSRDYTMKSRRFRVFKGRCFVYVIAILLGLLSIETATAEPVADAGMDRYVEDELVLDGTASYDPNGYGITSYQWTQTSGPTADINDANTAMPTIYFSPTDEIQFCEFSLVVSDGNLTSQPDTVNV